MLSKQVLSQFRNQCKRSTLQYRFLTTTTENTTAFKKYGAFREAPRGLGLVNPPEVSHGTWIQKKKQKLRDLGDYEKAFAAHAAERQYLVKEATKSYFHDANEMKEHGGKMYYASTQLMKPEKTGYMPDFETQDLSKNRVHTTDRLHDKITLMTFALTQFGLDHTRTFANPFWEKYGNKTKDIQLLEAFVTRALKGLPKERQDNVLLLYKDISRVRPYLDMTNKHIGYVYLIDENCKVRWTAHGNATQEEIGNMLAMTDYLYQKRQQ
ncbi:hypothetical protein RMCBS344292_11826 [Rhizopus microsporus]|nr:hypothetical protein RMCBS344292_11826 [Rhizopus microsporus]